MSEIAIVHVTAETAPLLKRVAEDVFDDAIDPALLGDFIARPGHALFVAVANGLVIGQIRGIVHAQPDRGAELYIDNLGVAPAYKRRGAARAMLRALAAWARAQGCESFWVATETDNEEGLGFYEGAGLTRRTLAWFDGEVGALARD